MLKPIRVILLFLLMFSMFFGSCGTKKELSIVFLSGANEYFSNYSLTKYKEYLENHYEGIRITILNAETELDKKNFPDLSPLSECDLALFFARRLTIDGEQLDYVKQYVNSGKPIIALRNSSHGFQNWLEFDNKVLGGNYQGQNEGSQPEPAALDMDNKRYPAGEAVGPIQYLEINPQYKNHPLLAGVTDFTSRYSLYKTSPVASDVQVLLTGTIPEVDKQPVAWTRDFNGARVFYVSLGGVQDFENENFIKMLTNAIFWASKSEIKLK